MKIGVDLDEVLAEFLPAFIKYHNEVYGTSLSRDDFHSYHFQDIVGVPEDETIRRLYDFHKSSYFLGIKPIEGSLEGVEVLGRENDLSIVTARQKVIEEETRNWIGKYFPKRFDEIHIGNNYPLDGSPSRTKREICDSNDIDLLVEDSLDHALNCLTPNRRVLLFDRGYPWNQKEQELPEGMVRVHSWEEVLESI